MSKTVKFAVSMPTETFSELEGMRRKAGQTRSQFVRAAVRRFKTQAGLPPAIREEPEGYGTSSPDLAGLEERRRRAMAAAGRFRSGVADLSSHHDEYLAEAYAQVSAVKDKKRRGGRR